MRRQTAAAPPRKSSGSFFIVVIVLGLLLLVVGAKRLFQPKVDSPIYLDVSGSDIDANDSKTGSSAEWFNYNIDVILDSQAGIPAETSTPVSLFGNHLVDMAAMPSGKPENLAILTKHIKEHLGEYYQGGSISYLVFEDLCRRIEDPHTDVVVARMLFDGGENGDETRSLSAARHMAASKKLGLIWILGVNPNCSEFIRKLKPILGDRLLISYRLDTSDGLTAWNRRIGELTSPALRYSPLRPSEKGVSGR